LLPPGEEIFHKSPTGDQWTFTHVVDFDADGRIDVLYGVHEGHIYLHCNLTTPDRPHFDTEGALLKQTDGQPIKVAPQPDQAWDFDVLQGARTTVTAADYNQDGQMDLVVGDTYGKVRYYENVSGGSNPTFAPPGADRRCPEPPGTDDSRLERRWLAGRAGGRRQRRGPTGPQCGEQRRPSV